MKEAWTVIDGPGLTSAERTLANEVQPANTSGTGNSTARMAFNIPPRDQATIKDAPRARRILGHGPHAPR